MIRIEMRNYHHHPLALLSSLLLILAFQSNNHHLGGGGGGVQAYLLLGNGKIYTVDSKTSWADSLAIDDKGVLMGVGSQSDLTSEFGQPTTYWDLKEHLVLPGFQDIYVHAVEAGITRKMCYVPPDTNLYAISQRIHNKCKKTKYFGGNGWIVASGIDITEIEDSIQAKSYDNPITVLDKAFPNDPVLILDKWGRGALVNSVAVDQTEFAYLDSDPPGGKLIRDANGDPTGIVRENAQHAFRNLAFPPSPENELLAFRGLVTIMDVLVANGITTVSDAGGFWKQAQTKAWEWADDQDRLKIRASNAFYIYPDIPVSEQLFILAGRFHSVEGSRLQINQARIYVDGILPLETAALKEPYKDGQSGLEYFFNLQAVADLVTKQGYQLDFQVSGDKAVSAALDTIAALANNRTGPHRLSGLDLVDSADYSRFKELGVAADFHLDPETLTPEYYNSMSNLIGSRAQDMFPLVELEDAGATVTLSSDWDGEGPLSPLERLQTAMTRPSDKSVSDLDRAIRMMTINPATVLKHASQTGSLEVGKYADLVIVSHNLFEMTPDKFDTAEVLVTLIQGERVYDPDGRYGNPIGKRPAGAFLAFTSMIGLVTIAVTTIQLFF